MTEINNAVTKNLTFRFGDSDFQIKLNFPTDKTRKAKSILDASINFFMFLKEIKIINESEEFEQWKKSGDKDFIFNHADRVTSLKIRKKAYSLGLAVIPGEVFKKNREQSLQSLGK